MNRKQAVSLVLRIAPQRGDARGPGLADPADRARRGHPRADAPHRPVARRRRWRSPWWRSCSRPLRWQKVLDVLGLHAGLRRLLSHYLAGQFVSNVLPTTIGGDVLRVSRLSRETGESPKSFASVVLERLTGWLVLPIISVVGFLVNPPLQHLGTPPRWPLGLAFATLLALVHRPVRRRRPAHRRALRGPRRLAPLRRRRAPRPRPAAPPARRRRQRPPRRLRLPARARAGRGGRRPGARRRARPGSPRCSPSSPPWPSRRCCRSASPASACARARSCCSSVRSAWPHEEAIALGLLLYLLNLGVSLLGAPAFAVGGARRRAAEPGRT